MPPRKESLSQRQKLGIHQQKNTFIAMRIDEITETITINEKKSKSQSFGARQDSVVSKIRGNE